ncbi:MAG: hypothetical protein Kow00117_18350 [Phototrophicales bacterium]
MPTPFTHLAIAQRLLHDVPISHTLQQHKGAFLLGNIAADARVGAGTARADTHFYQYGKPMDDHPWRVMVNHFPQLMHPHDTAHQVFLAGYVAHLSVDEYWTLNLTEPYFGRREWASLDERFFMLHILLIHMDTRDLNALENWQPQALAQATPQNWLPFMPDKDLCYWRDLIYQQIKPGGKSQTLDIFSQRINRSPQEIEAVLNDPAAVQARLWAHVPSTLVQQVESGMYTHAKEQMMVYWETSNVGVV